jgi:hypothetical protein
VAPDLFHGKPSTTDLDKPEFDKSGFDVKAHGPAKTDPIVAKAVKYLREKAGVTKVVVSCVNSTAACRRFRWCRWY